MRWLGEQIECLLNSELIIASIIASFAYLLKGWLDRNRSLIDLRVQAASETAETLASFWGSLGTDDQEAFEQSLRKVKRTQTKLDMFCSMKTRKQNVAFLNAANLLSQSMQRKDLVDEALVEEVEIVAARYQDALRHETLGWSALGISNLWQLFWERIFSWLRKQT